MGAWAGGGGGGRGWGVPLQNIHPFVTRSFSFLFSWPGGGLGWRVTSCSFFLCVGTLVAGSHSERPWRMRREGRRLARVVRTTLEAMGGGRPHAGGMGLFQTRLQPCIALHARRRRLENGTACVGVGSTERVGCAPEGPQLWAPSPLWRRGCTPRSATVVPRRGRGATARGRAAIPKGDDSTGSLRRDMETSMVATQPTRASSGFGTERAR